MTIIQQPTRNEFTSTAGQTVFSYTFKIFAATDFNVFVTPAGQTCNDINDKTTAFTVTGIGISAGGTITLNTPASDGDLITIVSNIPESRTTDYQTNGDFLPSTVNDDFDRVVSLVKQSIETANRSLVSAECQQGKKPLTLSSPSPTEFLRWRSDATGVESVDLAVTGAPVSASVVTYNQGGTGAVNRTVESRLQDRVSVADFGAVGGVTDDTTALNTAIAAVAVGGQILIPFATMTITSLDLNQNVELVGLGRANTILTVTSFGTDGDTSAKYGIRCIGDPVDGLESVPKLRGMQIILTTTTPDVHGLLLRRKTIAEDVYVRNATGDGIRFDTNADNNAVFFSRLTDVWSKSNKGYGCNLRKGANANVFLNCQMDLNGKDGYIHQTDGFSTNGNIIIGGQASFNFGRGINAASGTNLTVLGTFHELNSSFGLNSGGSHTGTTNPTLLTDAASDWVPGELIDLEITNLFDDSIGIITANTATTVTATLVDGINNQWENGNNYTIDAQIFVQGRAYTTGELVLAPAGVTSAQATVIYQVAGNYTSTNSGTVAQDFDTDFDAGDIAIYGGEVIVNTNFSNIQIGLVRGNLTHRIKNEHDDTSTIVRLGGKDIGRRLDEIRLDTSAGGQTNIYFNEAESDIFRIRYNGIPGNPANELLIQSQNGGVFTTVIRLTNDGKIAFFDATTQAQGAHISDPTGGGTVDAQSRTAINSILARLEDFGFSDTS